MSVSLIKPATDHVFSYRKGCTRTNITMNECQAIMDNFHAIARNWDATVNVTVGNEYVWLEVGTDWALMGEAVVKLPHELCGSTTFHF